MHWTSFIPAQLVLILKEANIPACLCESTHMSIWIKELKWRLGHHSGANRFLVFLMHCIFCMLCLINTIAKYQKGSLLSHHHHTRMTSKSTAVQHDKTKQMRNTTRLHFSVPYFIIKKIHITSLRTAIRRGHLHSFFFYLFYIFIKKENRENGDIQMHCMTHLHILYLLWIWWLAWRTWCWV